MSDIFEFLNHTFCEIVGHNWVHDFQEEGRIIEDPIKRHLFTGRNILNGKMGIFRCVRCGERQFRERKRGE